MRLQSEIQLYLPNNDAIKKGLHRINIFEKFRETKTTNMSSDA